MSILFLSPFTLAPRKKPLVLSLPFVYLCNVPSDGGVDELKSRVKAVGGERRKNAKFLSTPIYNKILFAYTWHSSSSYHV